VETHAFTVRTGDRFACADLTPDISRWLNGRGDGLCTVFIPHATAGVALFELGAGSDADVERTVGELLPRDDSRWVHRHGAPGHGADHVLPLLVSPSVTIPVIAGRMTLGTWQSVVLVDPNVDNAERTVRLAFVGG
jgi:secondary thiamine-phosphate synthase enzyme